MTIEKGMHLETLHKVVCESKLCDIGEINIKKSLVVVCRNCFTDHVEGR